MFSFSLSNFKSYLELARLIKLSIMMSLIYVVRYHVTRIKSEIIKAQKARKTLGKLNWAIQLSSFLSFCFHILLTMK